MFVLIVELEARPGCLESLEKLLESMVEHAGHEDGIVFYSANRPLDRRASFVLYELYNTRQDWERHVQHPFLQAALKEFEALLLAAPKITFCEPCFVAGAGVSACEGA